MGISGSFKASPGYAAEQGRTRENWGQGVDPGHEDPSLPDYGSTGMAAPPPMPGTPDYLVAGVYEPGIYPLKDPPYFPPVDAEPAGHDGYGYPAWGVPDDERSRSEATAARDQDRGAQVYRYVTKVFRDWTQTFETARTQSLAPPADGTGGALGEARRALRGFNALALNNPGSAEENYSGNYIRQGWEISRWTNRTVRRTGLTHTRRPIHLNLANVAHETEPQEGADYSPYGSPFVSRARVTSGISTPVQRREPRPWGEDATVDAADQDFAQSVSEYIRAGL